MTPACGNRLFSWWRNAPPCRERRAENPSRRCSVLGTGVSRPSATSPSAIRLAALPVGAATAIASAGIPAARQARTIPPMSAVFPLPGPPVTTVNGRASAAAMAALWAAVQRRFVGAAAASAARRSRESLASGPDRCRDPRGQRVGQALLQPEVAFLIETAAVDDERPVISRTSDERLQRRGGRRDDPRGLRPPRDRRRRRPAAASRASSPCAIPPRPLCSLCPLATPTASPPRRAPGRRRAPAARTRGAPPREGPAASWRPRAPDRAPPGRRRPRPAPHPSGVASCRSGALMTSPPRRVFRRSPRPRRRARRRSGGGCGPRRRPAGRARTGRASRQSAPRSRRSLEMPSMRTSASA